MDNRYTNNGTIFYKGDSWVVQLNYVSGGGAPFKVVKWATWMNSNYILDLQETTESVDMFGWKIATDTDILLYCGNVGAIQYLKDIKSLVEFGYKGKFNTDKDKIAEIEWRMNNG